MTPIQGFETFCLFKGYFLLFQLVNIEIKMCTLLTMIRKMSIKISKILKLLNTSQTENL